CGRDGDPGPWRGRESDEWVHADVCEGTRGAWSRRDDFQLRLHGTGPLSSGSEAQVGRLLLCGDQNSTQTEEAEEQSPRDWREVDGGSYRIAGDGRRRLRNVCGRRRRSCVSRLSVAPARAVYKAARRTP